MGSIKLSKYRTNVLGLLGDSDYDTTLVDQAINWFIYELHNNNRIRYMETSDELDVSLGDVEVDFPRDFMTLIRLSLTSPQVYDLKDRYVEYETFMDNYANYRTATSAQVGTWTDFGNAMRLAAPSKATATIAIDYLRVPKVMTRDNDTTDLPDNYEELVSKGSLARLMEINEDYAEAAQERNNLQPLVTAFIRNEARGGIKTGPSIIKAGRGRGAYNVARDF